MSFILKICKFLVCFIIVFWLCSIQIASTNKNDYQASISLKHKRLDSIKGRRVIFAGGSNLAFGIDSKEIQEQIKEPVVNMGIHARLGLPFILNELQSVIRKDDVVFLSLEYYLGSGDYALQKNTAGYFPTASTYFKTNWWEDVVTLVDGRVRNIKNNKDYIVYPSVRNADNENVTPVYSVRAFNSFGDVVQHLGMKGEDKLRDKGFIPYSYWQGIKELNDFYDSASAKQVKVFFLFPNFPESEYKRNAGTLSKYENDISHDLKFKALNKPADFVYPDSLFFDTVYHLNKEGREKRTAKLIELLKASNLFAM